MPKLFGRITSRRLTCDQKSLDASLSASRHVPRSLMMTTLRDYVANEIELSDSLVRAGELTRAFRHLERAHVLGQAITVDHTRVHWRMLKLGLKRSDAREVFGQI